MQRHEREETHQDSSQSDPDGDVEIEEEPGYRLDQDPSEGNSTAEKAIGSKQPIPLDGESTPVITPELQSPSSSTVTSKKIPKASCSARKITRAASTKIPTSRTGDLAEKSTNKSRGEPASSATETHTKKQKDKSAKRDNQVDEEDTADDASNIDFLATQIEEKGADRNNQDAVKTVDIDRSVTGWKEPGSNPLFSVNWWHLTQGRLL